MVMRMLEAGGMPLLTDHLRPPDQSNPHGYFEYEPVKRLRADKSWVPATEGKAVKVIYRLLPELPAGVPVRILFLERDLREVLASQRAMLEAQGQRVSAADDALILAAFEKELAGVRHWMSDKANLYLPFAVLIQQPLHWAACIAEFIDPALDIAAMAAAVDPRLYRNRI